MCLILFAYRLTPGQPLIVAANRDEFYARPSAAAHWWEDAPGLLAGRDLQAGGTWLGVQANGRFAAVTNFTDLEQPPPPRSRGALVTDFLGGTQTCADYAASIQGELYQGFNLLLWDGRSLACTSNRGVTKVLKPGCYALTNAELGARWVWHVVAESEQPDDHPLIRQAVKAELLAVDDYGGGCEGCGFPLVKGRTRCHDCGEKPQAA